jgi:hypothetical protein
VHGADDDIRTTGLLTGPIATSPNCAAFTLVVFAPATGIATRPDHNRDTPTLRGTGQQAKGSIGDNLKRASQPQRPGSHSDDLAVHWAS